MQDFDSADTLGRAVALHRSGRLDEAEALYRAVLQHRPADPDAHHLLGILCLQRGDATAALASFERAIAIDPKAARAHHHRGRALEALHRPAEALDTYEAALAIEPQNPEILNDRGLALRNLDRPADALASFERALAIRPDFLPALGNRGLMLMRLARPGAALNCFDRILALAPDHIEAAVNRARLLQALGDASAAVVAYERLLERKPGMVAIQGALAETLAGLGRDDEAIALCRAVLSRATSADDRDRLLALRTLALLPDPPADIDLPALLAALRRPADMAPPAFESMVNFALAALHDRRGDHASAWRHAELANAPLRDLAQARRAGRRRDHEAALAALDAAAADLDAAIPQRDDMPVSLFILGPSRSGKTMLERLVAGIPGVQAGGENALARLALERALGATGRASEQPARFVAEYRALLAERAGDAKLFSGTAPGGIRDLVDLISLVPNLRLVFLRRDRADTALRIYMKQYSGNEYAGDLADIGAYLDYYESMTSRLLSRLPRSAILLRYEDMVANPAAARDAVARLCGLAVPSEPPPPVADDRNCAVPYAAFMKAPRPDDQP
jgi:Tfp pilus assembly protein PilF